MNNADGLLVNTADGLLVNNADGLLVNNADAHAGSSLVPCIARQTVQLGTFTQQVRSTRDDSLESG